MIKMSCMVCGSKKRLYYSSMYGFLCWNCYLDRKEREELVSKIKEGLPLGDTGQLSQEDMNDF